MLSQLDESLFQELFNMIKLKAGTTIFRWTSLSKIPSSNTGRLLNSNNATQTHSTFGKL